MAVWQWTSRNNTRTLKLNPLNGIQPFGLIYFPNQDLSNDSHNRLQTERSAGWARGRKWKIENEMHKGKKTKKNEKDISHLHINHRKRGSKTQQNNVCPQFSEYRVYMLGFGYLPPRQVNLGPRKLNDVTFGEVKWLPEAYRRWGQAIILLTYLHLRKSWDKEQIGEDVECLGRWSDKQCKKFNK